MHKFIDNIVAFSLKNKFFIFFCTTIAVIAGAISFKHTPVDAFPDVTNTKVTIITQWPGRSAEEVEKFITIPVEIAMNPVQKKTDIRSTTLFGLSVINVMFEDDVDDFTARQQVYNLLNDADLPEGVTPEVQPLYGPTGEIYRYTLRSGKRDVRELKTIQDWVIDRNLRAVSGVADIVSFGGEVKTFEVSVNPYQHIGVLATAGTIKSESYPLEIHKLFPEIQVSGTACPMWVSLVENNESQDEGADYFIRKYIDQLLSKDPQIDTVILGCTHFPILLPKIRQYIPDHISVITQGEYVAESLKDYLKRHPEMDAKCTKNGNCQFYTTEAEEKFSESASTFLKQQISVKHITLE